MTHHLHLVAEQAIGADEAGEGLVGATLHDRLDALEREIAQTEYVRLCEIARYDERLRLLRAEAREIEGRIAGQMPLWGGR